ncbi:uridine diphosphate glucose pyrophosphatase NUDT14 [Anabrus simplex]|uniref:uridine diphosphate glucose pyrophosphatase NUDT14 n=1 Tax=Anabrus simplex TaxID=316456 RepID=UPI0035A3266F
MIAAIINPVKHKPISRIINRIILIMNDIHSITFSPLGASQYVKPLSMNYVQNGVPKKWDLMKIHDSVSILMYNVTRKVLVFVRQFRPAVYCASIPEEDRKSPIDTTKYPLEKGFTLELCAGIVDKDKSLEEIAREEALEECGYDIPVSCLKKVLSYRSGIGVTGDLQTLYFAEVEDKMRITTGGGNEHEGEFIEVVELTVPEVKKYIESGNVNSPGGFLFALMWFFHNKSVL